MGKRYRKAVVGVFVNVSNKVLILERADIPGSWQLPQGGVDHGENVSQALKREMTEELGTSEFEILKTADGSTQYDFPTEVMSPIANDFNGQSLWWHLLKFKSGALPQLDKAIDKEFSSFQWVEWEVACDKIVYWKKEAYLTGFKMLGFK